jgi:hypothetical protein
MQRSESPVHDAAPVPFVSKGCSCVGALKCLIRQVEGGFWEGLSIVVKDLFDVVNASFNVNIDTLLLLMS